MMTKNSHITSVSLKFVFGYHSRRGGQFWIFTQRWHWVHTKDHSEGAWPFLKQYLKVVLKILTSISLDNDMGGSDESCSRQDHCEGGEGEQAEAVKHLQVIDQSKINLKMWLEYDTEIIRNIRSLQQLKGQVRPWQQISTLILSLQLQHQPWGK